MKTRKMALYIVLLPVAVIIVASSLFLAFFDANDYKQKLINYVKESSGRSLVFKGDAELMLYPDFGMTLGAMQFSNAPGFGSKPMLSVDKVSISVDVKSVLMLQPKVSQLILSELHIDLQKNKQGVANWDDLIPEKAKQQKNISEKKIKKKTSDDDNSRYEIAGAFDGIDISNAQVSWRDDTTGESFNIDDLDVTTGKITPTEPFPLSLNLLMHKQKDLNAVINLDAQVFFDQKINTLNINQLDLKLKVHGEQIPVEQSDVSIKGDASFDIKKQFLTVSKLLLQAKIQDKNMPKGQLNINVKTQQLDLYVDQHKVDLKQLQLVINNLQLNGDVHIDDYIQPALAFKLKSKEVDIDELLGLTIKVEEQSDEQLTKEESQMEDVEIALPMELLRKLKLDGELSIGKLKVMNVVTSNNEINLKAKKGLIVASPISLSMYDGELSQKVIIDVRGDKPKYTIKTNLEKVQIGDLLIDFMQLDKIRGAATVTIDVTSSGEWLSKLKSNLNGNVSLRFADGALKGFNIRHLMDVAKAKITGGEKPSDDIQETDFTELKLSGNIVKGVFSSNDLSLKSPLIRVGGEGKADLNKSEVDYIVNAKIIGSLEGQSGEGMEATGLLVPVRIFGPFNAPKTDILIDNMLKRDATKKLEASKEALKAKKQKAAIALKVKQDKLKTENKAKLETEKEKQKAELNAKKQTEKEKAKKKLEGKLKGLFN